MRRYRTREHPGLDSARQALGRDAGEPLPKAAALAVVAPIEGEVLRLMNSDWRIPATIWPSGSASERFRRRRR